MPSRRAVLAPGAGARSAAGVAVASAALVAACNAIWGVDDLRYDGTTAWGGGGSGHSGGGSTTTTSSSTTSSGTTTTDSTSSSSTNAGGGGSGGATPSELVIVAVPGLTGDGFLADPDLCDAQVRDSYPRGGIAVIDVGRDYPCSANATYRAFVRFDLASLGALPSDAQLVSVTIELLYVGKTDPTAPVTLYSIDDFGTLDFGDWNIPVRRSLGPLVDPGTVGAQLIVRDASLPLLEAAGESHVAFELRYENENEDPEQGSRWYEFAAADNADGSEPRLVIRYLAP